MKTNYQIITIGHKSAFVQNIQDSVLKHIAELGMEKSVVQFIDESQFDVEYRPNAPTFCLYFGDGDNDYRNADILESLRRSAKLILPVVSDLELFNKQVPEQLRNINGALLSSIEDVEKVVASILEGLGLLRLSRRLFISYKRDESSTVAIQLFEQLEKSGFDVFLDTHSIRPGEPFQEELWHRLADTDVVVLLNTPKFLTSQWTTQELAKANSMSIGILQLIWPSHKLEREAEISVPFQLNTANFGNTSFTDANNYFTNDTVKTVVNMVESLRARSIASRQDNIITEFISSANKLGVKADLHSEKFISVIKKDGKEIVVIPTVGVPQAFTYNQSEELVARIKSKNISTAYLLFDHRNVREKWLSHLDWLDNYLPIKGLKITDIEKWLTKEV